MAKAAANSGASVETEPSISPARPGCTYCSTNNACAGAVLLLARALGEDRFGEALAMFPWLFSTVGEIAEQLAHADVLRGCRGLGVEALRPYSIASASLRIVSSGRFLVSQIGRRLQEALDVLAADGGRLAPNRS